MLPGGADQERPEEVRDRGHEDGRQGPPRPCGHEGGDGIGGVLEAVRQREGKGHGDGGDEDDVHRYAPSERGRPVFIAVMRPSCRMAVSPTAHGVQMTGHHVRG